MNPKIKEEYEKIKKAFPINKNFLNAEVFGRMEKGENEEIVKAQFIDSSLLYILTTNHLMTLESTNENSYIVHQIGFTRQSEETSGINFINASEGIRAWDGEIISKNQITVLVSSGSDDFELKKYQIRGGIFEVSSTRTQTLAPRMFHFHNNFTYFVNSDLTEITKINTTTGDQTRARLPTPDQKTVETFIPFRGNNQICFVDGFLVQKLDDRLQVLNLEDMETSRAFPLASEIQVFLMAAIGTDSEIILVTNELACYEISLIHNRMKKLPSPQRETVEEGGLEISVDSPLMITGGKDRTVYFTNTSDKMIYRIKYDVRRYHLEKVGQSKEPDDWLVASYDNVFITNTNQYFYLVISSFEMTYDTKNARDVLIEFGLSIQNTAYIQELDTIVFTGNQKKLLFYDLKAKKLSEGKDLDGVSLGLFVTGLGQTVAVATKKSLRLFDLENDLAETKILMEASPGNELIAVPCSNPVRMAIANGAKLTVFERASPIYEADVGGFFSLFALHPIELSLVVWWNSQLHLWQMEKDKDKEELKLLTDEYEAPSSVSMLDDLILIRQGDFKAQFISYPDPKVEYIISVPPLEQGRFSRIQVVPLYLKNAFAVFTMKELKIIDRMNFKAKHTAVMDIFEMIRGVFPSTHVSSQYFVLSQHVFGHDSKLTAFKRIKNDLFSVMPRGFGIKMLAQDSETYDAVYVPKYDMIRVVERDTWNFVNAVRFLPQLKHIGFAKSEREQLLMLTEDNQILEADIKGLKKFQKLKMDTDLPLTTFCTSPDAIFFASADSIVSCTLDISNSGERSLIVQKQVPITMSKKDPIVYLSYFSNQNESEPFLLVLTKRGHFYRLNTNLDQNVLLYSSSPDIMLKTVHIISKTGAYGVELLGESIHLIELATQKIIYTENFSVEKNKSIFSKMEKGAKKESRLLACFSWDDTLLALKIHGIIRIIDIFNAKTRARGESFFYDLPVEDQSVELLSFIKPGYTLMFGNETRMCRIHLAVHFKIQYTRFNEDQFIYFPEKTGDQKKLCSWFINQTGEIKLNDYQSNISTKVCELPVSAFVIKMCSLPDNSVMGYVTAAGHAIIIDVATGEQLFCHLPSSFFDSVILATNSIEQNAIIFQTTLGYIWILDLNKKSLEKVYDRTNETLASMVYPSSKNVAYLLKENGEIVTLDIQKKAILLNEKATEDTQLDQKVLLKLDLNPAKKKKMSALGLISSSNTLIACGKDRIIFFDCDCNRTERIFDSSILPGHSFSQVWLSDDERYLMIHCYAPTEKLVLIRTLNLTVIKEYQLKKSHLFKEIVFTGGSNFIHFVSKNFIKTYNLDTFGNALSNLILNSGFSLFLNFNIKRSFDFNLYHDLSSLSAFCFLSNPPNELFCIKIFEELIRENLLCKKEKRIDPLTKFVEGPNFTGRDMLVLNGFLIENNAREVQEIFNTLIFERPVTNPYKIDPFGYFLGMMDEWQIYTFFGEVFFEVYFANFNIVITHKGKRSIIVESTRLEKQVGKSWLPEIEQGEEEQILGNIKDAESLKSISFIDRSRLDIFDRELDNPKFLCFLGLLNILPSNIFKIQSVAYITDYYWREYKALGNLYLTIYLAFLVLIWVHSFFASSPGIQTIDIILITFLILFFIFYVSWEAILLYFQKMSYFGGYQAYATLGQIVLLIWYIVDVLQDGKVNDVLISVNMIFACLKAFQLMQYIDEVRQFSTRIIQVCYDIRVFLIIIFLLLWSFSMIFYTLSDDADKDISVLMVQSFDYFFGNYELNSDHKLYLFFQLLLMIAFPIIGFFVLISLVNASWENSGELGEAFDRKKVMNLLTSNLNVLRWVNSFKFKSRLRPIERMHIYMYTKPERNLEGDLTIEALKDIKKSIMNIEDTQVSMEEYLKKTD